MNINVTPCTELLCIEEQLHSCGAYYTVGLRALVCMNVADNHQSKWHLLLERSYDLCAWGSCCPYFITWLSYIDYITQDTVIPPPVRFQDSMMKWHIVIISALRMFWYTDSHYFITDIEYGWSCWTLIMLPPDKWLSNPSNMRHYSSRTTQCNFMTKTNFITNE